MSSSALSTATAVCALELSDRACKSERFAALTDKGFAWLNEHQNSDGGWGDTVGSPSNISTTTLCWAALGVSDKAAGVSASAAARAETWLKRITGDVTPSRVARAIATAYGEDRTFSVPILTMCALSGRFGTDRDAWQSVPSLPFELAALPHQWFSRLGLPVVSYALPALIAIGQARHFHRPTDNPLVRRLRDAVRARTLDVLASIQPPSGGFLEAAPLTSFVTMSLVSIGLVNHPVAEQGMRFLSSSAREDGSWPIDTNLSTWVTTLSINALEHFPFSYAGSTGKDRTSNREKSRGLKPAARNTETGNALADGRGDLQTSLSKQESAHLLNWLLGQQYGEEHPYTHAAPGGWAWTDLSGGVPDADDTSGALLALRHLTAGNASRAAANENVRQAVADGIRWLLDLQNRDGGIPTFCRGWGKLPFDRSSPDLTAHTLRAWNAWQKHLDIDLQRRVEEASVRAIAFLTNAQREDGSWIPLWFGNQDAPNQENPLYGTARVLLAGGIMPIDEFAREAWQSASRRGLQWLVAAQNPDGGWGGGPGVPSSIEETALAVETLAAEAQPSAQRTVESVERGCRWLIDRTDGGTGFDPAPIGLYFAKLWYCERLYPIIFTVAALNRAHRLLSSQRPE